MKCGMDLPYPGNKRGSVAQDRKRGKRQAAFDSRQSQVAGRGRPAEMSGTPARSGADCGKAGFFNTEKVRGPRWATGVGACAMVVVPSPTPVALRGPPLFLRVRDAYCIRPPRLRLALARAAARKCNCPGVRLRPVAAGWRQIEIPGRSPPAASLNASHRASHGPDPGARSWSNFDAPLRDDAQPPRSLRK
jgi:hypothetical protein